VCPANPNPFVPSAARAAASTGSSAAMSNFIGRPPTWWFRS
jgi:hypothetical protein